MGTLIMAGQLLLGLGMLVFIHELGHFLAARAFGIRVEKFYIFFDFNGWKLWSKKIGDTEYGIGWFPLGGYVKISGMVDESMDKSYQTTEAQPWEFRSKPAWQRFIVMVAGITMNIILGIFIFAFWLLQYQKDYLPPQNVTDGIYAYPLGREMKLQTGDHITKISGKPVRRSSDLWSFGVFFGADMTVERNGKEVLVDLPDTLFRHFKSAKDAFIGTDNFPTIIIDSVLVQNDDSTNIKVLKKGDQVVSFNGDPVKVYGEFKEHAINNPDTTVTLGILRNEDTLAVTAKTNSKGQFGLGIKDPYQREPYTLGTAFKYAFKDGFDAIYYNAWGLGKIFTGKLSARESIQSPIDIAIIYGGVWDWGRFWYLTGMISFILAFMNILPIPALDGGHVMFIIFEVIRGKPVSDKFLERAQVVGMVLLLTLMVFAIGNSIFKHM